MTGEGLLPSSVIFDAKIKLFSDITKSPRPQTEPLFNISAIS